MAGKFTDDRDPSGLVRLAKVIDEMGVDDGARRNPVSKMPAHKRSGTKSPQAASRPKKDKRQQREGDNG
jgi:hypothetical protein